MDEYTRHTLSYSTIRTASVPEPLRSLLTTPVKSQTPEWARRVIVQTLRLFELSVVNEQPDDKRTRAGERLLEDRQQRAVSRLRRLHREVDWEPREETLRDQLRAILFAQLQTLLQRTPESSSFQETA